MRGRYGILFGFAVLGALCGCGQVTADVEQPVEEVSFGEVVFKNPSSGDARQLSFCLQDEHIDIPEDPVVYQNGAQESAGGDNFIQKITATPMEGLFQKVDTKGNLIDDWDGVTFSIRVSFKRTYASSWEHVSDNLSYAGGGTWRTGYYYNLTGCYFVWISVFSSNLGYVFSGGYPNISVTAGQYSSQDDAVAGFYYLTNVALGDYAGGIEINLKHVFTALSFTFNGQGPSGRINSITVNGKVGCYLDGEAFYEIDEYNYYNYSSSSRSITTNKNVTSGSSSNILGSGRYLFLCHSYNNASITVSFSPSYGGTYSVTQSLPALVAGRSYNISLSFPSFPTSVIPYLYFSGGSATDNKFMYVDCNAQTVSVPIATNIDYTDPGTWGLSPSGYILNMYSSSYADIDVPANLYSYEVSLPGNTTYFTLSFDGPSGSPQDYVTSSNGLRICQYGTDIYAGPDYSSSWDFASDYENGAYPIDAAGETISRAFSHSSYDGDREYITTDDSWIHITDLDTTSGYDQLFSISFDANNTSSSRTGYITCYGSESGQSPYNVSRTYAFSQEPNLTYDYGLEISPSSTSVNVGESVSFYVYVYKYTYQGGVQIDREFWTDVTSSVTWSYNSSYLKNINGSTFQGLSAYSGLTVTATYDGYSGSASVTVNDVTRTNHRLNITSQSANSITVGDNMYFIAQYYTFTERYTYDGSSGFYWDKLNYTESSTYVSDQCTFTSDNPGTLYQYSNNTFRGGNPGIASVTASYAGINSENFRTVTVVARSKNTDQYLKIYKTNTEQTGPFTINSGDTITFDAFVYTRTYTYTYDGNGGYSWVLDDPVGVKGNNVRWTTGINWYTGNSSVVSFSMYTVTGNSPGTTSVYATFSGLTSNSISITVNENGTIGVVPGDGDEDDEDNDY